MEVSLITADFDTSLKTKYELGIRIALAIDRLNYEYVHCILTRSLPCQGQQQPLIIIC